MRCSAECLSYRARKYRGGDKRHGRGRIAARTRERKGPCRSLRLTLREGEAPRSTVEATFVRRKRPPPRSQKGWLAGWFWLVVVGPSVSDNASPEGWWLGGMRALLALRSGNGFCELFSIARIRPSRVSELAMVVEEERRERGLDGAVDGLLYHRTMPVLWWLCVVWPMCVAGIGI